MPQKKTMDVSRIEPVYHDTKSRIPEKTGTRLQRKFKLPTPFLPPLRNHGLAVELLYEGNWIFRRSLLHAAELARLGRNYQHRPGEQRELLIASWKTAAALLMSRPRASASSGEEPLFSSTSSHAVSQQRSFSLQIRRAYTGE